MKYILTLFIFLSGCTPQKPDLVINGREYVLSRRCVKSHIESKYEWHYGYNTWKGKWEWHLGWNHETVCDEYRTDTIEVNFKEKYYKKNIEK